MGVVGGDVGGCKMVSEYLVSGKMATFRIFQADGLPKIAVCYLM